MKNLDRTRINNTSSEALVAELKKCRHKRDLERGKLLHSHARSAGHHTSKHVANALISMYARCSSLQEALHIFNSINHRDISSWNALMLGYVENGKSPLALDAFTALDCQPNSVTYVAALKACGGLDTTTCSQKISILHSQAVNLGFHNDIYVASTLIDVYNKCGMVSNAREVFDGMNHRNVVSWTAMILGYTENGESLKALELYNCMDCEPNHVTFVAVLKACASLALKASGSSERSKCLEKGVSIHNRAKAIGVDNHIFVANTLLDMYSKCRSMPLARETFNGITYRSTVSWNVLIQGYVENGESTNALKMFDQMNSPPDRLTLVAALKACVGMVKEGVSDKSTCLAKGAEIHRLARSRGLDKDLFLSNTIVDMYGKLGDMNRAREVFAEIPVRDAVSWTALISGYVENGDNLAALEVFDFMDDSLRDALTYVPALKACTGLLSSGKRSWLEKGKSLHSRVRERGFENDMFVANTLVDMYTKAGKMVFAREVFDHIQERNVVSWNALLLGYVENFQCLTALEAFESMDCQPDSLTFIAAAKACTGLTTERKLAKEVCLQKGLAIHSRARELELDSDIFLANTLVDMYSKCGSMQHARETFDRILHPTVVSWTALILGYMENNMSSSALESFNAMDCPPNRVSVAAALKACASMGALEVGERIHDQVCQLGMEHDIMVANCLVDFYGKCGDMSSAEDVFNRMELRDMVSWNALIGGYGLLRETSHVFRLVKRMEECNVGMNGITLLLVLTACNHAGMVEEGERYFDEGVVRYGVRPGMEHYTCMVDMLCRANKLEDALGIVRKMPFEADGHLWVILLDACRRWRNEEVERVAVHALQTQALKVKD